MGSYFLLQGIFPTQGFNPSLPHCRQILYRLSHQGNPRILERVVYPFSSRSSWPEIEQGSPALQRDSLPTELLGKPNHGSGIPYFCHILFIRSELRGWAHTQEERSPQMPGGSWNNEAGKQSIRNSSRIIWPEFKAWISKMDVFYSTRVYRIPIMCQVLLKDMRIVSEWNQVPALMGFAVQWRKEWTLLRGHEGKLIQSKGWKVGK